MSVALHEATNRHPAAASANRRSPVRGWSTLPTAVLLIAALYFLLPVIWVLIASTKGPTQLFTTFSFWPSLDGGFAYNITHLLDIRDGVFGRWALNSLLYAGVGAFSRRACRPPPATCWRYRFAGREALFRCVLAGVSFRSSRSPSRNTC